jgi:hypothetical protein
MDELRRTARRGLALARRRDRVFVGIFQQLLDTMDLSAQQLGSEANEIPVRYPEDCERIQTVLQIYRNVQRTLLECEHLWLTYSESMAAGWMALPADDVDLATCVPSTDANQEFSPR